MRAERGTRMAPTMRRVLERRNFFLPMNVASEMIVEDPSERINHEMRYLNVSDNDFALAIVLPRRFHE